jgi:hypothetical protein
MADVNNDGKAIFLSRILPEPDDLKRQPVWEIMIYLQIKSVFIINIQNTFTRINNGDVRCQNSKSCGVAKTDWSSLLLMVNDGYKDIYVL